MKPVTKPADSNENTFLGGAVRVMQPVEGYRAGIDPILLAAAVPAQKGDIVLDAGCGVGSASLCLLNRMPDLQLTGVDIQKDLIDLARQNAALNDMNTIFLRGDIRSNLKVTEHFDHIMINPPFLEADSHMPSPHTSRALGRGETETTLEDWVNCAYRGLKTGGRMVMMHRTDRLDDIMQEFTGRFGSVAVFPLWPKQGRDSKLVLIGARKNKFAPLQMRPGMIMHNEDGSYTHAAQRVLMNNETIDLWGR